MEKKLFLILLFCIFDSIHAMDCIKIESIRINHIFGEENTPIKKQQIPSQDTTKKIILQEQSLYNKGSDQGKILFPYSLSKLTDFFYDIKPEDLTGDPIFPIPMTIDQKSINKLSKILIDVNKDILPGDSREIMQDKLFKTQGTALFLLSTNDAIKLINFVEFLGIPGLRSRLENLLALGLKDKLFKQNSKTNAQEQLISDYTSNNIIEIIKNLINRYSENLKWNPKKEEIIKSQIKTLDQALFIKTFIFFLRDNNEIDLTTILLQNPSAKKIFKTFPVETQEILKATTKYHRRLYSAASIIKPEKLSLLKEWVNKNNAKK